MRTMFKADAEAISILLSVWGCRLTIVLLGVRLSLRLEGPGGQNEEEEQGEEHVKERCEGQGEEVQLEERGWRT